MPVGLLHAVLGSLLSAAMVVGAVIATSRLVTAPAVPPTPLSLARASGSPGTPARATIDTIAIVLEATTGTSASPHPSEQPAAPSAPNRAVSPLLEVALGARRRRRHLPLGAGIDAMVAIAFAAAQVLIAGAICRAGCECGICALVVAGRVVIACECT